MAEVAAAQCPQCGSTDLLWSKKRRHFVCDDCGHVFEPQVSEKNLRIFLSYGHDTNEELVLRICRDLEARGHDVWFDKNEIKAGDDWRREITDGILESNRVLSFLSKYSTRDPGVCRDEIAIAIGVKGGNIQTVLVESEQEVQLPVNIGHIQWLDMHDWRARHVAGGTEWEQWYESKFGEIVRVVENHESRRFAGEIEALNVHLKPIRSEARIFQLLNKGFYGRRWLFEAVENWRSDKTNDSRLFWIMGVPGIGKSAFAAQLTHVHGDRVIAAQFCEWDKPDHHNAGRVVRSLAFQLATRLPDYRKLLLTLPEIDQLDGKNASELFDYVLANPLRAAIHGGRERYLIVIDAVDEAGESGRNPLIEMLARNAQRLPEWLGFVITSRPEFDVMTPLQALNPFPIDTQSESNRADIREYLRGDLAPQLAELADANRIVEHILEKSEGVFLYVEQFCHDLHDGHISLDHPDEFPQGLGGVYADYFNRHFPDLGHFRMEIRPVLRAILAAPEPLPLEILQGLFNWQDEEVLDFVRGLGSLFPITLPSNSGAVRYDTAFPHQRSLQYVAHKNNRDATRPYHKALADWLADEAMAGHYFVSLKEGHRMLADCGWKEFLPEPRNMTAYSVSQLPHHLIAISDLSRLGVLIADQWFLEFSPVFYRQDFYEEVVTLVSPLESIIVLAPAHSFFAAKAAAKSPIRLGFGLFPHEPGVNFVNGTIRDGYMIPPDVIEPPSDVLWEFVKACESVFKSSSAFLLGARHPAVSDWYRDYWKSTGLQDTLIDIERYYETHHPHLSYQAMYLSYRIDKALENPFANDSPTGDPASVSPDKGKP